MKQTTCGAWVHLVCALWSHDLACIIHELPTMTHIELLPLPSLSCSSPSLSSSLSSLPMPLSCDNSSLLGQTLSHYLKQHTLADFTMGRLIASSV